MKKIKIGWGTGILLFIIAFLAACAAFIVYSQSQVWSLVEEDYYPRELKHEEMLLKMRNASALTGAVTITLRAGALEVRLPDDFKGRSVSGTLRIYRPSDEALDLTLPLQPDTALVQQVPLDKLKRGRYVVKLDWVSGDKGFYKEQDIYIP